LKPRIDRTLVIIAIAVGLAGCRQQETLENLKSCIASSEQTVLLRQLTAKNREAFENCRAIPNNERHCQALYLNANGAVRECMKQKGYIFQI